MNFSATRSANTLFVQQLAMFLLEYACAQLAAGGHTLRVARSAARLAGCFDCTCDATFLSRHVTMTVSGAGGFPVTMVGVVPDTGLNFRQLVALNNLSWVALDMGLSLEAVNSRFREIMAMPRFQPGVVMLGASVANAAFCRLFGGDIAAMCMVFVATLVALKFRMVLERRHAAPCLSFMLAAFLASVMVSLGILSGMTATPQTAMGASVLFLIPGVPMINSTLDLLTGFPLMAFSRLVRSGLLVSCIGIGLGCTLFLTGLEMATIPPPSPITCLWIDLVLDGIFAAIASMGFAMLSNPDRFLLIASGFLAALGHGLRFYLLQTTSINIIPASLLAALLIGAASACMARRFHIPGEFFSFLALLPMIPGMYAYGAILSTIQFMHVGTVVEALPHLVIFMKDFLAVLFIMCAMAIGAITPLLMQHAAVSVRK